MQQSCAMPVRSPVAQYLQFHCMFMGCFLLQYLSDDEAMIHGDPFSYNHALPEYDAGIP